MERFKFRCWDKENKKFLDDLSFDLSANGILILCEIEGRKYINLNDTDRYISEQSTGSKDKNSKLIYENDRVKFIWHDEEFEGTVIWYLSSWGIKTNPRFIRLEENFDRDNPKNIEVIGNIHEMEDNNDIL